MSAVENRSLIDSRLVLAVLIAAAIYYVLRKVGSVGSDAIDGAANWYADVTHSGTEVLGNAVLPNGFRVAMNSIRLYPDVTFWYNGQRYRLTGRRPDNDYTAVLA